MESYWDYSEGYTGEQRFHTAGLFGWQLHVTAAINGLGRAHVDLHAVVRKKKSEFWRCGTSVPSWRRGVRREAVLQGKKASVDQSRLYSWKLGGSVPQEAEYTTQEERRKILHTGECDGAADVLFFCAVCDVLTTFCLVCAYLQLTDPLSGSRAALRINTVHVYSTHTRLRAHCLICQLTEFPPSLWVLLPAKQMVNIQNESRSQVLLDLHQSGSVWDHPAWGSSFSALTEPSQLSDQAVVAACSLQRTYVHIHLHKHLS